MQVTQRRPAALPLLLDALWLSRLQFVPPPACGAYRRECGGNRRECGGDSRRKKGGPDRCFGRFVGPCMFVCLGENRKSGSMLSQPATLGLRRGVFVLVAASCVSCGILSGTQLEVPPRCNAAEISGSSRYVECLSLPNHGN